MAGVSRKIGWRGLTSMAVVACAVFIGYHGNRLVSSQSLIWPFNFRLIPNNKQQEEYHHDPKIFAITPNSGGLRLDAAIYERYLGAEMSLLEDPSPVITSSSRNDIARKCFYLFLEVTPNHPTAELHQDWKSMDTHPHSCRIMLMVNTDQFQKEHLEMPNLELLLCKTRQCVSWVQQAQQERLHQKTGSSSSRIPILYTGFTSFAPLASLDLLAKLDLDNSRYGRYLHVAGSSPHKGSYNILQAWLKNPTWPTLTITSYNNVLLDTVLRQMGISKPEQLPDNIHYINTKLSRDELSELMHSHGVHLCFSGMEGFGHYLNEARAVGAMVVVANYPSMNEMITSSGKTGLLVEPSNMLQWTNGLPYANIDPPAIVRLMNTVVLPMPLEERAAMGKQARAAFLEDQSKFEHKMTLFRCYLRTCSSNREAEEDRLEQALLDCAKECGLTLE